MPPQPPAQLPAQLPAQRDPANRLTRFLLACNRVVLQVYHRVHVESDPWTLPDAGPAIVIANHTSALDPMVIQAQTTRHIRWMMAREYLDIPLTTRLWPASGVIPVSRDGKDSAGARAALRVLADGHVLGIFPEGRIAPTRDLLPLEPGIGLLASRSKAPVYPVWIDGTQRGTEMVSSLLVPQQVTLRFGRPLRFDELDVRHGKGAAVLRQMAQALEQMKASAG
jgi:1-acyl-sn-glycerol-3-phosphate acyltransferase